MSHHNKNQYPKTIVFTDQPISREEGTGSLLLKYFSDWPQDRLLNIYVSPTTKSIWKNSICFSVDKAKNYNLRDMALTLRKGRIRAVLRTFRDACYQLHFKRVLKRFNPHLLSSYVYTAKALRPVVFTHRKLPGIPVHLNFWDLIAGEDNVEMRKNLSDLKPAIVATHCISSKMLPWMQGHGICDSEVKNIFCIDLPSNDSSYLTTRRMSPAIVGNVWDRELLRAVANSWDALKDQIPNWEPISWYCHDAALKFHRVSKDSPLPGIHHSGFFNEQELVELLLKHSISLLPFSKDSKSADYSRYSIPSSLQCFCAAGCPTFAIGPEDSALADYLHTHGNGKIFAFKNEQDLSKKLMSFATDTTGRNAFAKNARDLAETEFNKKDFLIRHIKQVQNFALTETACTTT